MSAAALPRRRVGPFEVMAMGLGAMNLSHGYGPPVPEADAARLLLEALDLGVDFVDTASLYGYGANESLVGRVLGPHRSRFVLASKCGMTGQPVGPAGALQRVIDGRPEAIRRDCEASLRRLGTDVIDLYYLHRWDKAVPVEDTVGALAELVRAGKVRTLGLSEVSAATLRRAHAVHPITAVQSEYSPWTRNPEIAVLDACRELRVAFVAFSPVARGFLTDAPPDIGALQLGDIRLTMPRFSPAHYPANLRLRDGFVKIAAEAGCTPAQLSLAWVLSRGDHVVPIPGTTRLAHLRENIAAATLAVAPSLLAAVDALMPPSAVSGGRYGDVGQSDVDTEEF